MTETIKEKIVKYLQSAIHPENHYSLFCTITENKTGETARVCGLGVPLEGYQYHPQDYRFPIEAADKNFKGIKLNIVKEKEHGMTHFNLEKLLDEERYSFNIDRTTRNPHSMLSPTYYMNKDVGFKE